MTFHDPWLLLLLVLAALPWVQRRRRRASLRYSSTQPLRELPRTLRLRARWLQPALRSLAIVLVVLALARPQKGNQQTRVYTEGIAIQLVVDRSGSMRAMDFRIAGRPVDRLTAVQKVVRDFVAGGEGLAGRESDVIGMICFARFADSKSPLTLDHGFLLEMLDSVTPAESRNEDGTAIGDAIALGVERLRSLDEQPRLPGAQRILSRIMVLLTDGDNNAGDIEPLKAAEMAVSLGIKVYTIGAGTQGLADMPVFDPRTNRLAIDPRSGQPIMQRTPVHINEDLLREIATKTGGQYFRATDTDSLRRIYGEIDKLEKTRSEEKRYLQYREVATDPVRLGRMLVPPLLLAGFVVLALEVLLASTALRRLP